MRVRVPSKLYRPLADVGSRLNRFDQGLLDNLRRFDYRVIKIIILQ